MLWNKYHERLLKRWAEMSKTYSIMHSRTAQYYATWDKRLGIPVVILGAGTSSSIFGSTSNTDLMRYVNGGLALFVAALFGISKFLGTREKVESHRKAAARYTNIAMDIEALMTFSRSERAVSPESFIPQVKQRIMEIRENVTEPPTWIVSDYLQKVDKSLTSTRTEINRTASRDISTSSITNQKSSPELRLEVSEGKTDDESEVSPESLEYMIDIPCTRTQERVMELAQVLKKDSYGSDSDEG